MRLVMALLVAGLVLAACGDSGESAPNEPSGSTAAPAGNGGETTQPPQTEPVAAPSGGGSGTLVVDGKTLDFDIFFCGFGPEETGNDDVPFSMRGSGTDDGKAFTIDGSIVTVNRDISSLAMWYDEDPLTLIYEVGIGSQAEFEINGNAVALTADFSGTDGSSVGEGSFSGNCP